MKASRCACSEHDNSLKLHEKVSNNQFDSRQRICRRHVLRKNWTKLVPDRRISKKIIGSTSMANKFAWTISRKGNKTAMLAFM
jgi:hypothetical protein